MSHSFQLIRYRVESVFAVGRVVTVEADSEFEAMQIGSNLLEISATQLTCTLASGHELLQRITRK